MEQQLGMCARFARRVIAVAVLLGVASAAGAVHQQRATSFLETPAVSDLRFSSRVADSVGPVRGSSDTDELVASQRTYGTGSGDISLGVSPHYTFTETQVQAWLDFIVSLLHGNELGNVQFYLAPPFEVAEFCGPQAVACYWPNGPPITIITPGEDPSPTLSAEAVLAHEYGHHVANSRPNPPWGALTYGTKRWASYVNVCAAVLAGQFFPGDGWEHYNLNPAEGFAEAFRVTNQRRLGVTEAPWRIVDERFYPDATAMALIEQDVLDPWIAHSKVTYRGRFKRGGPSRHTFSVSTGLDGIATASVRAPKGSKFRVTQVMTTVCGARTTDFTVRRVKGFGRFDLVVSRP